jgi:hypothetical protein
MNESEFPAPGLGAGISSQIEINRAKPEVLRNSRFLCWVTMSGSVFAAIMAVCSLLMVFSLVFPTSDLDGIKSWSALKWGLSGIAMAYMIPYLWKLGRNMAGYQVKLDSRGVDFNLGTKKKPQELFMTWDQIAAIKSKRAGNVQQFLVQGTDGSEARFTSYTFFRPKKVAKLIAARTGQTIQKA